MTRPTLLPPLLLSLGLLLAACPGEPHSHGDDPPHDHAAGAHASGEAAVERPGLSVTAYADGLELFMEYPSLVTGLESPLVAHFTDARDPEGFHVVTRGQVVATLRYTDGTEERFEARELLRAGIFKPLVRPAHVGSAELTLRLEGEQVSGTVHAGQVTVFPSIEAAAAAAPKEEPGAEPTIAYLKETQWKTHYATAPVELRALQGGVHANAEIKPVAGQAAEIAAPVAGRLVLSGPVPHVGQRLRAGQLIGTIAPVSGGLASNRALLELEVSRARSELELAERDLQRAEQLLADRAVPQKRVEDARTARDIAMASLRAAQQQVALANRSQAGAGGGAAFQLRSPIDGVVAFADLMPGAVVEEGKRLVSVVNAKRVWLEARVFESEVPLIESATGAAFTVAGFDHEFVVDERNGRRVAVGGVVDAATRTVPILFELSNPKGVLKPGMFAKATIFTGRVVRAVAIPEQAVVDDNGTPVAFVMDGGESFFKRRVRLGIRSGGLVEVREGVAQGERVVSRGAYEIKLSAAAGGIPEHGHQH